jgi:5-methyltetrahydrofolate--homocysteine methyltransferase
MKRRLAAGRFADCQSADTAGCRPVCILANSFVSGDTPPAARACVRNQDHPVHTDQPTPNLQELQALANAIINGDAKAAKAATEKALAAGVEPLRLVQEFMVPAMSEVGRRFECNDYFVPELLLSARAMKTALILLRPLLVARGVKPAGRVVVGTVKGDLHDIGKNLVSAMLEGGGFEVIDLGVNVTPDQFVAAVREKNPQIVAMSALLTTTMPSMKATVEALKQAGVRERVKVLIGGAPITQRYAEEIGADGYSDSAANAAGLARQVLG